MLSVPPTVPPLSPTVVMEELIPERLAMLEQETLFPLLDADLIVLSHTVVTQSVIPDLSSLEQPLSVSMNLVMLDLWDQPLATLKHVPINAEMELFKTMNNAILEVELELNPTMEPNQTNAERDVFSPSVVMVLKISMRIVILEPAMD